MHCLPILNNQISFDPNSDINLLRQLDFLDLAGNPIGPEEKERLLNLSVRKLRLEKS